jgi:hypothetical protein
VSGRERGWSPVSLRSRPKAPLKLLTQTAYKVDQRAVPARVRDDPPVLAVHHRDAWLGHTELLEVLVRVYLLDWDEEAIGAVV